MGRSSFVASCWYKGLDPVRMVTGGLVWFGFLLSQLYRSVQYCMSRALSLLLMFFTSTVFTSTSHYHTFLIFRLIIFIRGVTLDLNLCMYTYYQLKI